MKLEQMQSYTVWVGGVEVTDYYLTSQGMADAIVEIFTSQGYDDVVVEVVKLEKETN